MICNYHPIPGDLIHGACRQCGHLADVHVGCDSCPVCRLEDLLANFDKRVTQAISKAEFAAAPKREYIERHPEWEACKGSQ